VPVTPQPTPASPYQRAVVSALRQAFVLRPIWTVHALECFLSPQLMHTVPGWRHQLPAVAYITRSGPFRLCWIRLGLDPRTDPNTRVYQAVQFR